MRLFSKFLSDSFSPQFRSNFSRNLYVIGWGKANNRNKTLHFLSLSKQATLEERHLFCTITAESSDRTDLLGTPLRVYTDHTLQLRRPRRH